jgi:hypothetical protein
MLFLQLRESEHIMERLYRWLTDHKSNCNQIILAYILVTDLMNCHGFAHMNCHQIDWFSVISPPHRAAA